jgi:hypothetical protein
MMDLGRDADYYISYNSKDDLHPDAGGNFSLAMYEIFYALFPHSPTIGTPDTTNVGEVTVSWIPNHSSDNAYVDVQSIDTHYEISYKPSNSVD